jgi:Zn-dependent peptidase ImmA (M78 family)
MRYRKDVEIESKVNEILKESDTFSAPVKVEKIASFLDIKVDFISLGEDISGLLLVENGKGFIGVNVTHSVVRQRFTIAHEIGHFVLHYQDSGLFIDKEYNAFRNLNSSTGNDRAEIQANIFAAFLLMPKILLENHIKSRSFDLADDLILSKIAKDFEVSVQALAYRIAKLELF